MSKHKTWVGRIYLGRDPDGHQMFEWVGRFDRKKDRDAAVARRRRELEQEAPALPTCDEYVDRYLAEYARTHKESSHWAVAGCCMRQVGRNRDAPGLTGVTHSGYRTRAEAMAAWAAHWQRKTTPDPKAHRAQTGGTDGHRTQAPLPDAGVAARRRRQSPAHEQPQGHAEPGTASRGHRPGRKGLHQRAAQGAA